MAETDLLTRADGVVRRALSRARVSLRTPPVPDDHSPWAPDHQDLRRRLSRVRDLLEQARLVIERDGFTSGAWFTVTSAAGGARAVSPAEAGTLVRATSDVVHACLVGTLLRLAEDPDTTPSLRDAWGSVDELYEAMHEQLGHTSLPPGRVTSPDERRRRVGVLTSWNDARGRTPDQVLNLLDRAISRTLVGACRV